MTKLQIISRLWSSIYDLLLLVKGTGKKPLEDIERDLDVLEKDDISDWARAATKPAYTFSEIKSPVGQFTNLGVVEVPGVKEESYVNNMITAQADGRCIDLLIDPEDEKAGYIYINAPWIRIPC